ncbi:MAG: Rne/Rng family ribonuclease [Alphaproteobacteria bacterium]
MSKRMLIDGAHSEEVRVVVTQGNRLDEYDIETSFKKQIKGNIYLAKVTRVEPSLQAAFVDFGGNRHGFLAFSEIHPDYYQIPMEDRQALIEEQEALEMEARAAREHLEDIDGEFGEGEDEDDDVARAEDAEAEADAEEGEEHDVEEASAGADGEEPSEDDEAPEEDFSENVYSSAATAEDDGEEASDEGEDHDERDPDPVAADPDVAEALEAAESAAPRRTQSMRRYKIQEVIKRRQILLVQVVKEERGNKGAALTTYISLAGRYCVLMPNSSRGGGISRKITNTKERRKLRDTLNALDIPQGMGVIIRTAGLERSKAEIRRDFEYLIRAWDEVREVTLESTAPDLVYEEGNIIKRAIRDVYSKDIDEILIEGNDTYQTAKKFMRLMMPSHAKRVQPYRDEQIPLYQRFQIEQQLDAMHNPEVQLKSGGYIVINPTEALVAIDVNSGKSTRERNIEETALKTNIEAADEVARQLRLRDLAGLIVIDFIDMEDGRNVRKVERRLRDAMKVDRARLQIGHISNFGLLELSRQRLRPSLLETSSQVCPHCRGTGNILSTESMAMRVLRAIEEEGIRMRSSEITVGVPLEVVLYILNYKRSTLVELEERYGFRVLLEGDDSVIQPDIRIERVKGRPEPSQKAKSKIYAQIVDIEPDIDEDEDKEDTDDEAAAEAKEDAPKRGRRRRGRRRSNTGEKAADAEASETAEAVVEDGETDAQAGDGEDDTADGEEKSGSRRRRRGRRGGRRRNRQGRDQENAEAPDGAADETVDADAAADDGDRLTNSAADADETDAGYLEETAETTAAAEETLDEAALEEPIEEAPDEAVAEAAWTLEVEPEAEEPEAAAEEPVAEAEEEPEAEQEAERGPELATAASDTGPKRRGWWQRIVE